MKIVPRCTEVIRDILLLLTFVELTRGVIFVCIPNDPMNKTCTRIILPPQIFRPRLVTPHVPATQTKAGSTWRSGKLPILSGYTRRLGSQRTRVCAWLERGGIYNSTLMPHQQPRAFLQSRMHCSPQAPQSPGRLLGDNDPTRWGSGPNACSPVWADYDDPRAVTFKWIGTDVTKLHFVVPAQENNYQNPTSKLQTRRLGLWKVFAALLPKASYELPDFKKNKNQA
ncbi:hypothetical protein ACTXT7_007055 [Hymenolepis weldensis]